LLITFIDNDDGGDNYDDDEVEEEEEELLASHEELGSLQVIINNKLFVCAGDGPGSEQGMLISSRVDRLYQLHYCR
jgi:hypothetical protein